MIVLPGYLLPVAEFEEGSQVVLAEFEGGFQVVLAGLEIVYRSLQAGLEFHSKVINFMFHFCPEILDVFLEIRYILLEIRNVCLKGRYSRFEVCNPVIDQGVIVS